MSLALRRFHREWDLISHNARCYLLMMLLSNIGLSGVYFLLFNLYLVQIGFREDFIGVLSFVQMGAIAIGAVPTGHLSRRYGNRNLLLWGTAMLGLASLAQTWVTQAWLLTAFGFLGGIGLAMRIVTYTPYIANNTTSAERTLVFAANSAAMSIGGTLGNLIGGQLPAIFQALFPSNSNGVIVSFRLSLAIGAILSILAVLPMALAGEKTDYSSQSAPEARPTDRPRIGPPQRKDMLAFVMTIVLFSAGSATVAPFSNVYFNRVLSLSASTISFVFAVSSVLAAIGTLGASSLASRLGKVRAMLVTRMAGVPFLFLLVLWPGSLLAVPALVIRSISEMAGWPLDAAFLADVIPTEYQAQAVAYRAIGWNLTFAVTSFLAGQAIVRSGYAPLFLTAAIATTIGCLIYYGAFRQREP